MKQATLNRQLDNSGSMFWYEARRPFCDLDKCEERAAGELVLYGPKAAGSLGGSIRKAVDTPDGTRLLKLCQAHVDEATARWQSANEKHVFEVFETKLARDTILSLPA